MFTKELLVGKKLTERDSQPDCSMASDIFHEKAPARLDQTPEHIFNSFITISVKIHISHKTVCILHVYI